MERTWCLILSKRQEIGRGQEESEEREGIKSQCLMLGTDTPLSSSVKITTTSACCLFHENLFSLHHYTVPLA
jgi:hypothetical protein